MHHSDNKLGALIWRRGAFIWARVSKDLRDPIVLRDTKDSARNIKGFSPLPFIVICFFPLPKILNLLNIPYAKHKASVGIYLRWLLFCADLSGYKSLCYW